MRPLIYLVLLILAFHIAGCNNKNRIKPLKPLTVATGEWEPYVGEQLPKNGPLAELMSAVLADLGYVPIFKFYDWGIVERQVYLGYPSMAFPYLRSKERLDTGFMYSAPITRLDYVLFYHKRTNASADQIRSLEALKSRLDQSGNRIKIAKIKGYTKLDPFDTAKYYQQVNSAEEGFNLLIRDSTVQYFLESRRVGLEILKSNLLLDDKDDFSYLGNSPDPGIPDDPALAKKSNFHILLSPRFPVEDTSKLNEAIRKLDSLFLQTLEEKIAASSTVRNEGFLHSRSDDPIYGFSSPEDQGPDCVLPENTRVIVIEWHASYLTMLEERRDFRNDSKSQVKILNGPLRGKVMWVMSTQIHLDN